MIKSQPSWLGPGFEIGTSQIRAQYLTTAPPHPVAQFLFRVIDLYYYYHHHVKDFAASVLKRKIFLKLADAVKVFDFHFNLEFVLFGVSR